MSYMMNTTPLAPGPVAVLLLREHRRCLAVPLALLALPDPQRPECRRG
jgi:hypothetical protein